MAEQARLVASVFGQVQGVGFRWFAQREARHRGIGGCVANDFVGDRVEVVAEGSQPALEQFLHRLRQGPAGGRVDRIEVQWLTATGEFDQFLIRH
ncbi:MAG: acylphosphatase [Chloroflexota bacterium]